ncbi:GDSL-type esterase/lipase family protein [Sphingomonas aracearum]|uniref:SGNH hydrolase-type esterase domain-containing protein n=1 Tax=Sphingomonas aracearum TaxID=2283317 RepID=A0A369VVR2_9SPHN|nr:GDSL-type esterase/lipase family protein [Sphingomonas aracearum]RDE05667.1 hypothetical protein DVW87_10655 [Sphingomonas aracearum]
MRRRIVLGSVLLCAWAGSAEAQTAMTPDPCSVIERNAAGKDQEAARAIRTAQDWPNLCRYAAENAAVTARPDAVFIGDSLTEGWQKADPGFFSLRVLNRGISGQTSAQILARFYQDVVALRPRVVHILAGSNDVAGNTGPTSMAAYQNNMRAMADMARANGIAVVIGSVLPADRFGWATAYRPAWQLREMNDWLRRFAAEHGYRFVDYHAAMSTAEGAMRAGLSEDRVHPNAAGYAIMAPLARAAVLKAR